MDILHRKIGCPAFLGIKADRNTLYCTDIIHRTTMFKIGQGNPSCFLIHSHRRDWRRNLLDQCQMLFSVFFIGPVDQFFKERASKPSGIPGWHQDIHSFLKQIPSPIITRTKSLGSGAVNIFPDKLSKGG